jgi:RNA polymerase sigma-70 factor (ECF subfamily)
MDDIDRLFREYHTPIVRYLTRQLGDADLAEELAQETFLRAMRHGPVSNERSWLFAVASNLIRDTIRNETRQRKHLELLRADEAERVNETVDEPPELTADALREAAYAREALHTIPERDRMALFMSQEGLNYHEIAAALELSVQSVGTTLTRARKKVVQNYEALVRAHETNRGTHVAS